MPAEFTQDQPRRRPASMLSNEFITGLFYGANRGDRGGDPKLHARLRHDRTGATAGPCTRCPPIGLCELLERAGRNARRPCRNETTGRAALGARARCWAPATCSCRRRIAMVAPVTRALRVAATSSALAWRPSGMICSKPGRRPPVQGRLPSHLDAVLKAVVQRKGATNADWELWRVGTPAVGDHGGARLHVLQAGTRSVSAEASMIGSIRQRPNPLGSRRSTATADQRLLALLVQGPRVKAQGPGLSGLNCGWSVVRGRG